MKLKMLKIMWRFWPGILGLVVAYWIFASFANPHPVAVFEIASKGESQTGGYSSSHDGRFLICHCSEDSTVQVVDLLGREVVLTIKNESDPCGFDPKGNFIWVEMEFEEKKTGIATAKLWQWSPVTKQKSLVCERKQPYNFDVSSFYRQSFYGLHRMGRERVFSLLSPDGQTWLVPHCEEQTLDYDLVDVACGKTRVRLSLTSINTNKPYSKVIEAEFTNDSSQLIVQHEERQGDEVRYRLRWFDVISGQETQAMFMPGVESAGHWSGSSSGDGGLRMRYDMKTDNLVRLKEIIHTNRDHLVATSCHAVDDHFRDKALKVFFVNGKEYKVVPMELTEFQPASGKWWIKHDKTHLSSKRVMDYHIDPTGKFLVSSCQYEMTPEGGMHQVQHLPIHQFSVRNVKDGSLVHAFQVSRNDLNEQGYCDKDDILAVLPGPKILMCRHDSPKKDSPEEWLEIIRGWINPNITGDRWKLFVLDARTGKSDLITKMREKVNQAVFQLNQSKLLIFSHDESNMTVQCFDYPFRPWFKVGYWAIAVAILITFVVEMFRRNSVTYMRNR